MQLVNISNKLTKLLLALVLLLIPLFTTIILPNTAYAVENGKIVYTVVTGGGGTGDIYTMNPNGNDKTQLTNSGLTFHPNVSPDGTKISYNYVDMEHETYFVATVNIDGSDNAVGSTQGIYPGWLSSNDRIIYADAQDGFILKHMMIDGSNKVSTGYNPSNFEGFIISTIDWSPDGLKFAYPVQADGSFFIYTAKNDGSDNSQLTTIPFAIAPQFSPDGSKIYFLGSLDGESVSLYSINSDGSGEVAILSLPSGNPVNFLLSPDGTKFLYSAETGPDLDMFIINIDGSSQVQIPEQGKPQDLPVLPISWSPDSTQLVFAQKIDNYQSDIFTINADGTSLTNLTNTPEQNEIIGFANQSWARVPVPTSEEQSQPLTGTTSNSTPISLVLPGSATNASLIPIASNTIPTDPSFTYPSGLTSFQFDTEQGATETITLYFDLPGNPQDYTARKYNTTTKAFTTIPNATITRTTYNNQSMLKLTYQITDGGDLDQDNTTNGTIVDPVGLAQTKTTAPDTGLQTHWLLGVKN